MSGISVAYRGKPGRAQRPEEKIGSAQDEVGERKRATKPEPVRDCATHDGQEPYPAAKHSCEAAGAFDVKMQSLVQVAGEHGENCVVGQPLEKLADVGYPEWPFESGTDFVETFRKGQSGS